MVLSRRIVYTSQDALGLVALGWALGWPGLRGLDLAGLVGWAEVMWYGYGVVWMV